MQGTCPDDTHGECSRGIPFHKLARDGAVKPLKRAHQGALPRLLHVSCLDLWVELLGSLFKKKKKIKISCLDLTVIAAVHVGQITQQSSRLARGAVSIFN